MRILLADDHALVRSGLRVILAQIEPDAEVIEAGDGRTAIAVARRDRPSLCLLDISMPDLNGLDALPLLQAAAPAMQLLVLSMHRDREYVVRALRGGAQGYLVKDSAVDELADAIRTLRQGRVYVSRVIADALVGELVRETPDRGARARTGEAPESLTVRQGEVLRLIATGRSTREMAERLHLSVKTIETHRADLMRRLDIFDVAGLTRYAIRHGLVSPHD
jgi:DNA-binding NarL/FixJ family response regulator